MRLVSTVAASVGTPRSFALLSLSLSPSLTHDRTRAHRTSHERSYFGFDAEVDGEGGVADEDEKARALLHSYSVDEWRFDSGTFEEVAAQRYFEDTKNQALYPRCCAVAQELYEDSADGTGGHRRTRQHCLRAAFVGVLFPLTLREQRGAPRRSADEKAFRSAVAKAREWFGAVEFAACGTQIPINATASKAQAQGDEATLFLDEHELMGPHPVTGAKHVFAHCMARAGDGARAFGRMCALRRAVAGWCVHSPDDSIAACVLADEGDDAAQVAALFEAMKRRATHRMVECTPEAKAVGAETLLAKRLDARVKSRKGGKEEKP